MDTGIAEKGVNQNETNETNETNDASLRIFWLSSIAVLKDSNPDRQTSND